MDTGVVCIAVLAHGQADEIDPQSEERIKQAVQSARRYAGMRVPVVIVLMAGVGKVKSGETLATKMSRYTREVMGRSAVNVPVFSNHGRSEVWGTILEMQYAKGIAERQEWLRVEFVTNRRHGVRVLFTNALFTKIENCGVIESLDEPDPWWHEVLAYLKLGVCLLGLGGPAEAFRRKFYS